MNLTEIIRIVHFILTELIRNIAKTFKLMNESLERQLWTIDMLDYKISYHHMYKTHQCTDFCFTINIM